MKIRDFYCDGFGIFCRHGIDHLPDGLMVFIGNNESGKTTLMEFLRTMLFGVPTRRNQRNDYLPLWGGKCGGRLTIETNNHCLLHVEWNNSKWMVTTQEGVRIDTATFRKLLGNVDRETYERIFAVGLNELQGLDVLSQENVKSRLFSASAGLGAASLPNVLKKIDRELDSLLTKKGQKPLINQCYYRLKEIKSRVKSYQDQSSQYAEYHRRLEKIDEMIHDGRRREEQIRERLMTIEKLEHARKPWIRLVNAQQNMVHFEFAKSFPVQGLGRLEKINQEIDTAIVRKKQIEDDIEHLQTEIENLTGFEDIIAHLNEVEICIGEREKLLSMSEEYPRLKNKNARMKSDLQQKFQELGPDWNRDKLNRINTSLQIKQNVESFKKSFNHMGEKIHFIQNELNTKKEIEKELSLQLEILEKKYREYPQLDLSDLETARKAKESLRTLRTLFQEWEKNAFLHDQLMKNEEEKKRRLAELTVEIQNISKPLPAWLPLVILGVSIMMSILFYQQSARWTLREWMTLIAGSGGAIVLLGVHWQQKTRWLMGYQYQNELKRVEKESHSSINERDLIQKRLNDINQNIDQTSQDLFRERPKNLFHLEQLEKKLEDQIELLHSWQQLKKEHDDLRQKRFEVQQKIEEVERELNLVIKENHDLEKNWQEWLQDNEFPTTLHPDGFQVILQTIDNARVQEHHVCEGEEQELSISNYLQKTRSTIHHLLQICGETSIPAEPGIPELDQLREHYATALEKKRKQDHLKEQLEHRRTEKKILEEQILLKQKDLLNLFHLAEVNNEESYRHKADAFEKWCSSQNEMIEAQQTLQVLAGSPDKVPDLIAELETSDSFRLQEEKRLLENNLEQLLQTLHQNEQEHGAVSDRMKNLANNEVLGELLFEEQTCREQLQDHLKHWATLVLTRYFLQDAQAIYERDRQPRVIQEANQFIQQMTNQRYRLLSSIESHLIQLEDRDHHRKIENHWSSGLADQVYLAVRLGLALEFGRSNEPLPIILDDVLVKFDPERQSATAQIILRLAKDHQVFLFSCHPETKTIIQDASASHDLSATLVSFYRIEDGIISTCKTRE